MRILRAIACWWLGHAHDGWPGDAPECARCGKTTDYDGWVETPRWVRLRALAFPRKCPDCGGRWRCRDIDEEMVGIGAPDADEA